MALMKSVRKPEFTLQAERQQWLVNMARNRERLRNELAERTAREVVLSHAISGRRAN